MAQSPATQDRVNDFVIKLANVNGTGSASANTLLMKSIFRMGVPVTPKNIFPSNIQGLPTWYEVRVSEKGYLGRREGVDVATQALPGHHRVGHGHQQLRQVPADFALDPVGHDGPPEVRAAHPLRRGVEGMTFQQLTKDLDSRAISITVGDGGDYTRLSGEAMTEQLKDAGVVVVEAIIDKQGKVAYIDVHDIGEQPENAQIIEHLRELA